MKGVGLMLVAIAGLGAAGAAGAQPDPPPDQTHYGRRIAAPRDAAALQRLRRNSGITLQWIGWDRRGRLHVRDEGGRTLLEGGQRARDGRGRLELDGELVWIMSDRFRFRGRILIADTPDPGRNCLREGDFTFQVTRGRRYWRLQEMEQCNGLADYVDIYF
jgi:hypothetical protein